MEQAKEWEVQAADFDTLTIRLEELQAKGYTIFQVTEGAEGSYTIVGWKYHEN